MLAVTIIDKRVEITRRFYIDTTTSSTITPVWTAERYISFTAKVYRAITTITSLHKNLCMIVQHILIPSHRKKWRYLQCCGARSISHFS